eukprot:gene4744-5921_t
MTIDSTNKQRIILVVKIPEIGITKKILFDQVDTIKEAIELINEKLPPGCIDPCNNYNIYLPQQSKWCKYESRFSKYQFKENQEIEYKRDTRSGITHILNSVGNLLLKPSRTIYIRLPEIVQVGLASQQQQQTNTTSPTLNNEQLNNENTNTTSSISLSSTPPASFSTRSRGNSVLRTSSETSATSTPSIPIIINKSSLSSSTSNIPKLNLSSVSQPPSPSSSPRVLEQKKSLLKIIGISPRSNSLGASGNSVISSNSMPNSTVSTPRSLGTFAKTSEMSFKTEAFDLEDETTLKELLHKIYEKYQYIDKDLLDDYSLITNQGQWLVDRSKTVVECGLKNLDVITFQRMTQKVKIIFLNRELVLNFNPGDTISEINQKIIINYIPSLIKLHRSNSIMSPTITKSFRSSLSLEPISVIINDLENASTTTNQVNTNNYDSTRAHRSYSDASPLSFSKNNNETTFNHQQQNVELYITKRKGSISNIESPYTNNQPQQPQITIPNELLEFKDFKLHLCSMNTNPSIVNKYDMLLDENRQLSSYNFWNNVTLHFKNSTKGLHYESSKTSFPFYINVESEPFGVSHILEIDSSASVYDAIKFYKSVLLNNENVKINDSLDEYGFYIYTVDLGKREGLEYGGSIQLDPSKPLSFYPLEPLDKLIFKRTNSIFGVDPSGLYLQLDPTTGFRLPSLLIDLKAKFLNLDGFSTEGVFRVNHNNESTITHIMNSLSEGTLVDGHYNRYIDPHSIASFIKRWFMRLPKKICSFLDEESLLSAATSEQGAEQALESIPESYRNVLLWLVRFLSEIAQSASINKMSAKNLAIVVGPVLIDSNAQSAIDKLQQSTSFIQHLIKMKLRENGFMPLSYSSYSNHSSSFVSTTGSASPISSAFMSRSPSLNDIIEE